MQQWVLIAAAVVRSGLARHCRCVGMPPLGVIGLRARCQHAPGVPSLRHSRQVPAPDSARA
jgi:hypothetical protein